MTHLKINYKKCFILFFFIIINQIKEKLFYGKNIIKKNIKVFISYFCGPEEENN